jgi:very-short-patch-repair endonuclease
VGEESYGRMRTNALETEARARMQATKEQARKLRRSSTPAEKVLWERLRHRQLQGLKFLRQYPIGPFVADFCCRDRRLIVELDGEVHERPQQAAHDSERDAYLKGLQYVVLRFPNQRVLENLDAVVREIATVVWKSPPPWLRSKSR